MIHLALALAFQIGMGLAFGLWAFAAACASAFFIARELAQAEYRWIEHFGGGSRAHMPWWGPFDIRVWRDAHSWLGWILPMIGTGFVAAAMA